MWNTYSDYINNEILCDLNQKRTTLRKENFYLLTLTPLLSKMICNL